MRIVVVGAGAVGAYLADRLASEGQDVVLIESDEHLVEQLQQTMDVLVLLGNGASRAVLEEARTSEADLVVAVTSNDGVNILACHNAKELGAPRTVARIEDAGLRPGMEDMGVDIIIDPNESVAEELVQLLPRSGVSDIASFADGQLTLLGDIVPEDSPMVGRRLAQLRAEHSDWQWTAALLRDGELVAARGDTEIKEHDHVLVMAQADDADRALDLLGLRKQVVERVVVLGGTRLAELAIEAVLDAHLPVVVIEGEVERATYLAEHHPDALVVHGDPTDPDVLSEQRLSKRDAVVALSGWDEINAVGALLSKALGAGSAVARFQKVAYSKYLVGSGIDAAVSSRLAAANAILQYVRRGRIFSVATFKDSDAEAMEIEIAPKSAACQRLLSELALPPLAVVGGVVREDRAFVPTGDTLLVGGDHLIVLVPRTSIGEIEALCGRRRRA